MTRRLFTLTALAPLAHSQTPSADLQRRLYGRLEGRLGEIEAALDCVLGIHLSDLTSNYSLYLHHGTQFAAASIIKIPIMATVFAQARSGVLKLETPIGLKPADAVAGGRLYERVRTQPVSLTVQELLVAMMDSSDNTATNALIRLVGLEAVNRLLDGLQMPRTRLQRVMLDAAAAREGRENVSTPSELARLMMMLHRGELVDPASSRAMRDLLRTAGREMRAAIPADVPVMSKWGELPGVRGEVGLVDLPGRPYALAIMATHLKDGDNPVTEVTKLVHAAMQRLAQSNAYGHRVQ